jgi:hypothetical protein
MIVFGTARDCTRAGKCSKINRSRGAKESLTSSTNPLKARAVSLPYKDAGRSLRLAERERCPRAGARHLRARAASGKRPAGTMTGLRLDCWTGTGNGGLTTAEVTSQEARLELNGGVGSLPQEPRWNAGRRARPAGREPHPAGCGCRVGVCRRSACLVLIFCFFFVARVSAAKPGDSSEAYISLPDIASLIRATACAKRDRAEAGPTARCQNFGVTRSSSGVLARAVPHTSDAKNRIARTRALVLIRTRAKRGGG